MSMAWNPGGEILSELPAAEVRRLLTPAVQSEERRDEYLTSEQCGKEHGGPCSLEKTIIALSASLSQSFQGTSKWSATDTSAGLLKLYNRHMQEKATDNLIGIKVVNPKELEEMLVWVKWSMAAYAKDRLSFAKAVEIENEDVEKIVTISAVNKPAFFIALYRAKKRVVMGIRGTYAAPDLLTDLNPHNVPFLNGTAHSGMLRAAKWLFETERHTLQRLLKENPEYKLVFTGHSLGGAIASLLTMLADASTSGDVFPVTKLGVPSSNIFCWGYGCAPCVDRTLAESFRFICNVVLQDDLVPRVTPAAIEVLRNEMQNTVWSHGLKDGKTKKLVEKMEKVSIGKMIKSSAEAGWAVFSKLQMLHVSSGAGPSEGGAESVITNQMMSSVDDSWTDENGQRTDEGVALTVLAAASNGCSTNMQELEKRRLYIPGVRYHIQRQKIKKEERIVSIIPAPPFRPGKEAPRNSKYKHVVIRGTDPTSHFSRIVLSRFILFDHKCPNYIDGMLDALGSTRILTERHSI